MLIGFTVSQIDPLTRQTRTLAANVHPPGYSAGILRTGVGTA